ncbi:MAG: helix-turn-helix transcriptional regulator [Maribacter litoralis]|uniref:helix-turn-helix transcriptional regulator n=1 Tax=Maribacter litoralis TaxID=2059726 RepID=UPI0032973A6F
MLDINLFISRLKAILTHYELSSSAFADLIEVQRSSISHLLNGRNKPSLEFIMKIDEAFSEVDINWLLYGTGSFPKPEEKPQHKNQDNPQKKIDETSKKIIERIVIFYTDGTFKIYSEK